MFIRRLWILLCLFAACGLVFVARLFQLQILNGHEARAMADAALIRPAQWLPPVRGSIVDRNGLVLASDEPAVDLCVHYGVLSMSPTYLKAIERGIRREAVASQSERAAELTVPDRIRRMWETLAEASGIPMPQLLARRERICARVESLRRHIWEGRRRADAQLTLARVVLAEEREFHPILQDLNAETRAKLDVALAEWPFVALLPSVRRRLLADVNMATACGALVGQLREAPAELLNRQDPDDVLQRYRPGDLMGVSGLERLGESTLRGMRGMERRDLDGAIVERMPARDGGVLKTSLDVELQSRIYALLSDALAKPPEGLPTPTGASCAVLLLPSREVLALVSYPAYNPHSRGSEYARLRDDLLHRPLVPRVVADQYPPGSLAKPAALLTALSQNAITPQAAIECRGALFPGQDAWRCWTHWKQLPPHGPMNGSEAIQHSCNVYFYTMGGKLGPTALLRGMGRLIFGPTDDGGVAEWAGIGLIEERKGLMPSPARQKRELTVSDARNYAIGQGELEVTPLQAATLMATLACGNFLPPTLVADESHQHAGSASAAPSRTPQRFAEIQPRDWSIVRSGMFRCVNEYGGTAYPEARLAHGDICGKTGSAESVAVVVAREFRFAGTDGAEVSTVAATVDAAREQLGLPADAAPISRQPIRRAPPNAVGKDAPPTHAWFAGFAPRDTPRIAIAVLLEFGGGGGKAAAPVGRRVFEAVARSPRGYLPIELGELMEATEGQTDPREHDE